MAKNDAPEGTETGSARDRFIHLAEARTRKAIKDIRLIGNLSNRSNYSYTDSEVAKIFRTLEEELRLNRKRFDASKGSAKEIDFSL